jgi:hypothetical protein
MDQTRVYRRYVLDAKASSALYEKELSLVDIRAREDNTVLRSLPRLHEKINTGSFQRFQKVSFTL